MPENVFRDTFASFMQKYHRARGEISRVVVGLDDFVRDVFVVMLGKGHLLVESAPGLGKTTALETIAAVIEARFTKLPFNANIMPDDLVHTFSPSETTMLRIDPGPILEAEIFFANELNRGTEKTQSSLMSAMEEGEVRYQGELRRLPKFHMVVADINPVETRGTYDIPEALAERFLVKINIAFPGDKMLRQITAMSEYRKMYDMRIEKIFTTAEILGYAAAIYEWYASQSGEYSWLVAYAGSLVRHIRDSGFVVCDKSGVPASPSVRGAEDVKTVARLYAFLDGSPVILPKHAKRAAFPALRGKFFLNQEAKTRGLTHDAIIADTLEKVPVTEDAGS